MSKRISRILVICSTIFAVSAMLIMVTYNAGRAEAAPSPEQEIEAEVAEAEVSQDISGMELVYDERTGNSKFLCIPLPNNSDIRNITTQNLYMNQTYLIQVLNVESGYYSNRKLTGSIDAVEDINVAYEGGSCEIAISLNGIYECREVHEDGNLYLEFMAPKEMYDRIVVIDPGHGGDSFGVMTEEYAEKDLTLDIALRLENLLQGTNIRVYFTRLDDSNPDIEKRVQLANNTKADIFISIHAAEDQEESSVYGISTFYNQTFFIPEFSSADLAYILEEEIVAGANGKALGLQPGDEGNYLIRNAMVPVSLVEVGYMTNKQEAILLQRGDYRQKLAEGIYNGILRAYDEKNSVE